MSDSLEQKDIAYAFAKNIVGTQFASLTPKAVDCARKSILDTLGVIAGAGSTTPSINQLVELVRETGGRPESTIIGFSGRVPSWMAAFANGAMAHCLDYDDIQHDASYHPSSVVVPSAFAVAESNRPVDGREFITAVALAQDLGIRLALCLPPSRKPPWHRTAVLGAFASAAVAARLLKLDEEQIVDALGIAFCQSAGTLELRWSVGTDIGGMYAAFPSKAGVLSARLAQKGIAGIKTCFEGQGGLFNTYFEGRYDREVLAAGLGKRFTGDSIAFKPWPACVLAHVYIDAALQLMKENGIRPESIDHVFVYVGDYANTLCEPLAARRKPTSGLDAKFSIPFCVALAIVKGNVVIDDFSPSSLGNTDVLGMAQRVTPKLDEALNNARGIPPGAVEIHTRQGKTLYRRLENPYGHPSNPVSWEVIARKFRDCMSHARPVPGQNIEKIIGLAQNLEQVSDVAEIIQLLGQT